MLIHCLGAPGAFWKRMYVQFHSYKLLLIFLIPNSQKHCGNLQGDKQSIITLQLGLSAFTASFWRLVENNTMAPQFVSNFFLLKQRCSQTLLVCISSTFVSSHIFYTLVMCWQLNKQTCQQFKCSDGPPSSWILKQPVTATG